MLEGVVIHNNWFKLMGFEDDKLKETRMAEFFLDKSEFRKSLEKKTVLD